MASRVELSCDELRERYQEGGETAQAIARDHGCSAATVLRRLRACGLAVRGSRYQAQPPAEGRLRQLYSEERLPLREVARQLGLSYGSMNAWLQRYQIARRPPLVPRHQLVKLRSYGLSVAAIAELAAMGSSAVVLAVARSDVWVDPLPARSLPLEQRAYMSGLRRSWFEAERSHDARGAVVAYARSEEVAECMLFSKVFSEHGEVGQIGLGRRGWALVVALPSHWSFVLASEDRLPNWIRAEPALLLAFTAGLLDGGGALRLVPRLHIELRAPGAGMLRQLGADLAAFGVEAGAPQLIRPDPKPRWLLRLNGYGARALLEKLRPWLRRPA